MSRTSASRRYRSSVWPAHLVLPVLLALLFLVAGSSYSQETASPPSSNPIEIPRDLLTVPVLYEGRTMPLESAGRLVLYRFSGRNKVGEHDAAEWFVRLLLDPFAAVGDKVFLVDNPAALEAIGFEHPDRGRYSYGELYPYLGTLNVLAAGLTSVGRALDPTEQELVNLGNNILLFEGLATSFDLLRSAAPGPDEGATDSTLRRFLDSGEIDAVDLSELPGMLRLFPVPGPQTVSWRTVAGSVRLLNENPANQPHLVDMLESWDFILPAYLLSDQEALVVGSGILAGQVRALRRDGADLGPTAIEALYTRVDPVRWAGWTLLAALALYLILRGGRLAVTWARIPLLLAFLLLTAAQVLRFLITHRPPVTDLPASFHFVTWIVAATGLGLTFGRVQAGRIGVLLSTLAGLGLIYLARLVTAGADIFGVVRAVLDTNFWLTTHVLVVTAGYAGVVAAGVTGHVYLIGRLVRPHQTAAHQSTYRVMFVLMLAGLALSFLGTILGGIWADQSWGRFWGWDPKENGALLIVLWASIALHARVTRWFDHAAFAATAVFGNVVVLFSWLGVNLMGVGLHSYGFNDSSFVVLVGVSTLETLFALGSWLLIRFARPERGMTRGVIDQVDRDGDAVVLTIRGEGLLHAAGQYLGLKPEGFDQARPFSFVDTGTGDNRFLIAGSGPVSTYLSTKARGGEPVLIGRAAGEFEFVTASSREVVMVAGGVGIAPIIGLLRQSASSGNITTLIFAVRDHFYLDADLRLLEDEFPTLRIIRLMSQPTAGWGQATGRISIPTVTELLASAQREGRGADWYICGSPEFCETAREIAQASGASAVIEEEFTQAVEMPPAPTFAASAVFLGPNGNGGRSISVARGQTILSASLDAGIDLPHSCMTGSCGECGCTVASGTAVQGVAPANAGPGDTILACVAYPAAEDGLVIGPKENE